MEHLKKKYIMHVEADQELAEVLESAPTETPSIDRVIDMKGNYAIIYTDTNELFQTFQFEDNGHTYLIPEPNPITIYFDVARWNSKRVMEQRVDLFKNPVGSGSNIKAINGNFHKYFTHASSVALFLFTALEAFINKLIPPSYQFKKELDKGTMTYNKDQIQRNIEFSEKIKSVIPEITGKNFVQEFGHKYELIKSLKLFRDEIAHTKTYNGEKDPNYYERLFSMSLSFRYEETLYFVKDYINYYQPNLIEECECGVKD